MKRLGLLTGALVLSLAAAAPAYAADSASVMDKLKEIQKQEQSQASPSQVLMPTFSEPEAANLPTAVDIKQQLGEDPAGQVAALSADITANPTPEAYFKLAIAEELSGDGKKAIEHLHNAIALAPSQKELYQELVGLYADQDPKKISVFVDGDKLAFDVDPVIVDGSTLVPIRKIMEKLGAAVTWDQTAHTASITLGSTNIQLIQDSTDALVSGSHKTLEVSAKNLQGNIMVPLRFISESLGKNVDFIQADDGTAIIPITSK